MEKRKIYGTIIGIMGFIALVIGVTYAWFTWNSTEPRVLSGTSGCFTIEYVNGTSIGGNIIPSSNYTGGKSTTATLSIATNCTTEGEATINLTSNGSTTVNLSGNAVKYAVYNGASLVSEGIITGGTQALATVDLTKIATTYTIYVWIDGEIADNSYIGKSYSGYIHVSAVQTES